MTAYAAVEIRTTNLNSVLEVGVVIDNGASLDNLPVFHCYIDQTPLCYPNAQIHHSIMCMRIALDGRHSTYLWPKEVRAVFHDFLIHNDWYGKTIGLDGKIIVAAKSYHLLDRLLDENEYIRIDRCIFNPAIECWQPEIDGRYLPNMDTCITRAGLGIRGPSHNAVDEARLIVRLIRQHLPRGETRSFEPWVSGYSTNFDEG